MRECTTTTMKERKVKVNNTIYIFLRTLFCFKKPESYEAAFPIIP